MPGKPDKGNPKPIPIKFYSVKCLACARYFLDFSRDCPYCGVPRGWKPGWY